MDKKTADFNSFTADILQSLIVLARQSGVEVIPLSIGAIQGIQSFIKGSNEYAVEASRRIALHEKASAAWKETAERTDAEGTRLSNEAGRLKDEIRALKEEREHDNQHHKVCMVCGLSWFDPENNIPCPRCDHHAARQAASSMDSENTRLAQEIESLKATGREGRAVVTDLLAECRQHDWSASHQTSSRVLNRATMFLSTKKD